jgi:hypothetical protein
MARQKFAALQISKGTHKDLKEIQRLSGVAIGRLADLGLNFFCGEFQRGTLIIQNGQIIIKPGKAT